jgi:ADP-heptose:LPS heptosyltransferase
LGGASYIYLDMAHLSYVQQPRKDRLIWKQGGHAIDIILRQYGVAGKDHRCEFFLSEEEEARWPELKASLGIPAEYIVLEPSSNQEWFGDLRSWPRENWLHLLELLQSEGLALPTLVQVGVPSAEAPLPGVIDLRGRTSIQEMALVLRHCRLFVGTEGGLMHLANASGCRAVILWGGLTLPEFIGYQEYQRTLHHRVFCAPCGLLGNCPNGKICMTSIRPEEVKGAVLRELSP